MKKMYKTLMFALTLIGSTLWAQQPENGAQIRIQKNENGKETVIIRKMEKDNIAELEKMIDAEEILRTLGVPGENEEIEVIIRKKTIDADGSAQAPETGRVIPNCKMDVAPKKAFLGVYFNPEGGETGTEVTSIVENSPAQKAGLEKGDIIVKVESEKASAGKDLRDIISEFDAGQKVKIEILRKGEKKKIQVVLGEKEIREERKIIIREPKTKLGVILDPVMDESGETIGFIEFSSMSFTLSNSFLPKAPPG